MLTFGQPVQWAVSCDLLERTQQNLTIESDLRTLSFYMKPYEVKTIRVKLAAADQETV
jgi:hypothetical protein